jgi:hypothetical protein
MSTRIVCVETLFPHRHITHVGTGTAPGQATKRWTVMEVRAQLRAGYRFYTQDPVTGRTADVEPYDAHVGGGRVIYTIRSTPDAISGNNLDNLRACSWK